MAGVVRLDDFRSSQGATSGGRVLSSVFLLLGFPFLFLCF